MRWYIGRAEVILGRSKTKILSIWSSLKKIFKIADVWSEPDRDIVVDAYDDDDVKATV